MTTALAPQTVQRLTVEHFKRVTDVEIVPDATTPTVLITGRNAQGKSSILDALETVFTGVDKRRTPAPVHEGSSSARIVAETEALVITRTFKAKDDGSASSALTVTAKDGARYGSPQKMLDDLLGNISVDPVEFANQDAKKQRATLLSLVDLPFDLDALDRERAEKFARRTDANRQVKNAAALYGAAKAQLPPAGTSTEETSAGDLITRIHRAQDHDRKLKDACDRSDQLKEEVETLERRLERLKGQRDEAIMEAQSLAGLESEDAEELMDQLESIEETNRQARNAAALIARAEALEAAHRDALDLATTLDTTIQTIDRRKADGLAKASFPVEGLGVSVEGVTYQGRPFEQASTAERIRVSVGVATAKPGTIRVLLIRGGEALDSENLALIREAGRGQGLPMLGRDGARGADLGGLAPRGRSAFPVVPYDGGPGWLHTPGLCHPVPY